VSLERFTVKTSERMGLLDPAALGTVRDIKVGWIRFFLVVDFVGEAATLENADDDDDEDDDDDDDDDDNDDAACKWVLVTVEMRVGDIRFLFFGFG